MIIFDAYHNECADTLDNQTLVAIPYIPLAHLKSILFVSFLKNFFATGESPGLPRFRFGLLL